jgi:hypothetical protein
LKTALPRIVAWLEANSQFDVDYIIQPTNTHRGFADILNPYAVDWSRIPRAQFVFLLNAAERPSVAGGTWGVGPPDNGHFRDATDTCAVIGMSYHPWWVYSLWSPDMGFPTNFELTVMHEWKNAICSWINDALGYNIKNTYGRDDGYFIDCTTFPPATERTDCYGAFLAQITPEMYAALATDVPLIPISN